MKRTFYIISMMLLLFSCSTEESTDDSDAHRIYDSAGFSCVILFNGIWDEGAPISTSVDVQIAMTGDSIFISSMPDQRLLMMAVGDDCSANVRCKSAVWDVSGFAVRIALAGHSQQAAVYDIDADDYKFRVRLDDGWHTLTVRFAFDSKAAYNSYSGTLTLWLVVRTVSIDGRVVEVYNSGNPTLTLISAINKNMLK